MPPALPILLGLIAIGIIICPFLATASALCDGTLVARTNETPSRFEAVRILNGIPQSVVTLSPPETCSNIFDINKSTFCCLTLNSSSIACADLNGNHIWWDTWSLGESAPLNGISTMRYYPSHRLIVLYNNSNARVYWGSLQVGQETISNFRSYITLQLTEGAGSSIGTFNTTETSDFGSSFAIFANGMGRATSLTSSYGGETTSCTGATAFNVGTHLATNGQSLWNIDVNTGLASMYANTIYDTRDCASPKFSLTLPFRLTSAISTHNKCPYILGAIDPNVPSPETPPSSNSPVLKGVIQFNCNNTGCETLNFYNTSVQAIAWTPSTVLKLAQVSDRPCPQPPPGSTFACVNGIWVTRGSVNTTTIPVSGTVVVSGNLTVSTSTTIYGLGSSLNISDCASINGSLVLVLSEDDIQHIKGSRSLKGSTQRILIYSGECSNFDSLSAIGRVNGRKCAKVNIKLTKNSRSTLNALIEIDTTACNLWWIILLSVIAAIILIAVIVLALLFTFFEPCRYKVRPFSKPRNAN